MSSRALRRAQRELEEKLAQERLAREEQDEDESEEQVAPKASARPSLFAMLGDDGDGDGDGDDGNDADAGREDDGHDSAGIAAPKSSKKSRKKKKTAKAKATAADSGTQVTQGKDPSGLDEIDQALLALNLTANGQAKDDSELQDAAADAEKQQLFAALSIDNQHLHADNEMKKLFGRAALQHTEEQARPRQRGGPQGGIAAAIAGRTAPGNRNLASIGLRRNIFIQGKEEWPRATSGGLGMEMVEKRADGSVEYRFVHNSMYREVQQQFQICVRGMDPDRMVQLLQHNPYHISTLLQVSEIAKQQRDNATASDLLERALFTFGRSVHSTFSGNLAAGKARLDFRRPENREFWLAVWRYIMTLGVRATWRTALEWARLLMAMDPEQDPYCLRLLIDQLALRGREPRSVVDLVEVDYLQRLWKVPPNLAFSVALAHDRLKQPQQARSALRNAIKEYPWLAARLCRELDLSPIPKPIWGKEPCSDYQELLCQMYVLKAKDLWNTTEGTSLLVEVCYYFHEDLGAGDDPYWLAPIAETDLARHVILSDNQNLIALLDPRVKNKYTSASDPLPPDDSIRSYDDVSAIGASLGSYRSPEARQALMAELEAFRQYFDGIGVVDEQEDLERLGQTLERAGTSLAEYSRNREGLLLLQMRLQQEGIRIVFPRPGEEDE